MKLLFVADGRSPIALQWMRYFVDRGDDVYLASTFFCQPDLDLRGLEITPVAFSGSKPASGSRSSPLWGASTLKLRSAIRQWLGPLTIAKSSQRLRSYVEQIKPDLVHALRIPYEGMLASDALIQCPLIVSVWGNDFTLHAPSSPLMSHYTRWTMKVANALHADCQRDIRIGREWGFAADRPTLVTPGNGGIRTDLFFAPLKPIADPIVINPRGFRSYVRNDIFFKSIPLVLKQRPDAKFMCANMAGEAQAETWINDLGITDNVTLLPAKPHADMAEIFRAAQIVVSPGVHDGTPNSLIEAMACGCFPVAGDLESIREWITPDQNGLLVDPNDPKSLADAILRGLNDSSLRGRAMQINAKIIQERAEYGSNMKKVGEFYEKVALLIR
jgi:glycosyltransferase involved in cell wall biosynthesis